MNKSWPYPSVIISIYNQAYRYLLQDLLDKAAAVEVLSLEVSPMWMTGSIMKLEDELLERK